MQITGLLLKTCPWPWLHGFSLVWAALAFWAYRDFPVNSLSAYIVCAYFPGGGSLLYILIFYLSYGLPMMATLTFLKHALCEEYYYTRVENRVSIAAARLLASAAINGAILLVELCGLCLWISIFHNKELLYDVGAMAGVVGALLLPRLTFAFLLVLCSILKYNLIIIFTILTGILFSGVLVRAPIFEVAVLRWFDVSKMTSRIAAAESILAVLLVCAILYADQKRDISMQEDIEKNDE